MASSGVAYSPAPQLDWPICEPDFATQGKLRALGRLLRIAGEQLMNAALGAGVAVLGGEPCRAQDEVLHACATALQDVAGALLSEQWVQSAEQIGVAKVRCSTLFPQEHLAALQSLLTAAPTALGPQEALTALSQVLEVRAQGLTEACEIAQEALIDAAGTLRAAARLFSAPRATARSTAPDTPWDVDDLGITPRLPAREITARVAKVPREQQKSLLRALARRFHPDVHPGREMEVLPVFLHVQKLRDELDSWPM